MQPTQGQLEAEFGRRLIQFEKEHLGRGPEEARTHIFGDVIFVRLSGVLTRAEKQLIAEPDGARLIKEMRLRLMERVRGRCWKNWWPRPRVAGWSACTRI